MRIHPLTLTSLHGIHGRSSGVVALVDVGVSGCPITPRAARIRAELNSGRYGVDLGRLAARLLDANLNRT